MKLTAFFLGLVLIAGCNQGGNISLKSDDEKLSYVIGQQIGMGLKSQGVKIDSKVLAASIDDVVAGRQSRMTSAEMQQAMSKMQSDRMAKQMEAAKDNKVKADKFLEENKGKKGVKVTKSGLQYEVITEGKGPTPKASDVVKVHYKGTLIDGTEFDSSYKRGQPAEFPVGGVIKGWTEALQLMKVGSKWKLVIPPELAYGDAGRPSIPPHSVLVFEIELLGMKGKK